jgi:hypothetical protein
MYLRFHKFRALESTNSNLEENAIFPNQIWEKTLPVNESLFDSAKKRETGFLINYEYLVIDLVNTE